MKNFDEWFHNMYCPKCRTHVRRSSDKECDAVTFGQLYEDRTKDRETIAQLRNITESYRAILLKAEKALRFYSGVGPEDEVIEYKRHACSDNRHSGWMETVDWNGDLQDGPGEIAIKALKEIEEARAALGEK